MKMCWNVFVCRSQRRRIHQCLPSPVSVFSPEGRQAAACLHERQQLTEIRPACAHLSSPAFKLFLDTDYLFEGLDKEGAGSLFYLESILSKEKQSFQISTKVK